MTWEAARKKEQEADWRLVGSNVKKQILFYRRKLLTFRAPQRSKGIFWKAGPPPNGVFQELKAGPGQETREVVDL